MKRTFKGVLEFKYTVRTDDEDMLLKKDKIGVEYEFRYLLDALLWGRYSFKFELDDVTEHIEMYETKKELVAKDVKSKDLSWKNSNKTDIATSFKSGEK